MNIERVLLDFFTDQVFAVAADGSTKLVGSCAKRDASLPRFEVWRRF